MKVYELPELPYEYTALEPNYSSELLALHHDKHHAAYVRGANGALEALAQARAENDYGNATKLHKDLAFHVSGHVLHSLFWRSMSPKGNGARQGAFAQQLDRDLGGLAGVRAQMSAAATSLQGAGWALVAWEPLAARLVVEQVYDHQSNVGQGTVPLLALDMWEHSSYLQYGNAKAEWVKKFWDLAHWRFAGERFERARALSGAH